MTVLKAIYFPTQNFVQVEKKSRASWIRASLLKGRDFLLTNGQWMDSDGKTIRIWKDKWLSKDIFSHNPYDTKEDTINFPFNSSNSN